ncbi:MAG: PhzF family phenazine biosynthesis protein [Synechococcaceae bacterium WB9_2_112]|nr:PhzF family phenazine biosynthesis protein [Synechococcaceae bacterium WB9_2_112]
MTAGIPAVLIEAFSDRPCQGNGAAVVALPHPVSDPWMQGVARSLNQSETAFVLQLGGQWCLRWFSPTCEVPLCGHATLAALLALQHWGTVDAASRTVFFTRSGPLPVGLSGPLAQIELPAALLQVAEAPADLTLWLRQQACSVDTFWRSSMGYSAALLTPESALESLPQPPLEPPEAAGLVLMQALSEAEALPLVAGRKPDYQLRFFAPGLGIAEDPVTGSAHALVAPYWQQRLGRQQVVGWQCSDRPGGMVCDSTPSGMIRLSGTGSLLWSGHLQLRSTDSDGSAERWRQLCTPG